jgi:type II secretory pathway pseudopilin PulG
MCWPVEFLPNKLIYSKETTLMIGSMLAFALNSCGGNEKEQKEEEPANALEAIQQMAKEAEEMQNKEPVEPIDFRKLKELLPATAAGLSRTEATGKKNGAMGMMGLAAWSIAEVDKETATGYEKTTKIDGNKAYEKYDNDQKDGEIERPRK